MTYEFKPHNSGIFNAFIYRDIDIRFVNGCKSGSATIGEMDIFVRRQNETAEGKLGRIQGLWQAREVALKAAQLWGAQVIDRDFDA